MSLNSEMRRLRRQVSRKGWLVTPTGKGHWRLDPPHPDVSPVFCSNTPSDRNAIHRVRDDISKREAEMSILSMIRGAPATQPTTTATEIPEQRIEPAPKAFTYAKIDALAFYINKHDAAVLNVMFNEQMALLLGERVDVDAVTVDNSLLVTLTPAPDGCAKVTMNGRSLKQRRLQKMPPHNLRHKAAAQRFVDPPFDINTDGSVTIKVDGVQWRAAKPKDKPKAERKPPAADPAKDISEALAILNDCLAAAMKDGATVRVWQDGEKVRAAMTVEVPL